jgi:hypothetical protein
MNSRRDDVFDGATSAAMVAENRSTGGVRDQTHRRTIARSWSPRLVHTPAQRFQRSTSDNRLCRPASDPAEYGSREER